MDAWPWKEVLVLVNCLVSVNLFAAEVSAFRLTEFNGELALRYLYDEQSVSNSGVEVQNDIRPTFQQELKLSTSSYVYHPYLLNMDISGSLLLDQSRFESSSIESSTEQEFVNLNANFNFLEKKPFPITLYYNQQNPSVTTGIAGRFTQENIRYGIDASLMQPISPVLISIKAFHQTMSGDGFEQIVDDEEEQVLIRLYSSYASGAHMELTHQENQIVSSSGSPNLAIISRETSRSATNFDSRNVFGRSGGLQLTTSLSRNTQDQYPAKEETIFSPTLNWKHNTNFDSYYRLSLYDSTEEMLETDLKQLATGMAYHTDLLNSGLSLLAEDNVTTNVDSSLVGIKYNLTYKQPVSSGEIQFNFNSLLDYRDQTASVELAEVFDERQTLSALNQVALDREYIIINSITNPIVVSNENRTQVYEEGVDYRLIPIGVETKNIEGVLLEVAFEIQIQRLVGGSIVDGQTVVLDYSYQTGGTFAYDRVSNSVNLNWSILKSYDVYLRYQESNFNLQEGTPSIQLNSMTSYTYGVRGDKSLLNGIMIGGEVYQEHRDEEVDPYNKQGIDAFIEMPLPRLTNLRLTARIMKQNNENSPDDTDLKSMTVRVRSRPWLRGTVTWESRYENDVGGSIERLVRQHRLRLSWKIRQLSVGAAINYSKEQQDDIERERWEANFTASRSF